jgi:hypothetical protein
MPQSPIEKGQSWVESQLVRLADDTEVRLTGVKWSQSPQDKERDVHTASFSLDSNAIDEKFTSENLTELSKDRRLRSRIEHRLKSLFRSAGLLLSEDDVEVVDETEKSDKGVEYRYSITSYGADYPVDGLVRRVANDDIFIPPFQRKFVWSRYQSSRFVESLLLGLPVPAIFLGKEEDTNKLLVIDGQQRLRSLQHFYKGEFEGGDEFVLQGVASRFEGLSYRTLPEADRRRLDDSIIHAIVVKQDEPEDDNNSSIYLLFERLNTGGSLLHPQEIRACIFHGPLNDLIAELNENTDWRAVYGPENQRMKDRELILRFFTLLFDLGRYSKPMEGALNKYMSSNRRLQRQSRKELVEAFVPTIETISSALGTTAFRPVRAINAAVFDAVMVAVARQQPEIAKATADRIKDAYFKLLDNPDFKAAYEVSTSSEDRVNARIDIASRYFAELV